MEFLVLSTIKRFDNTTLLANFNPEIVLISGLNIE